jgi:hypothetical protein
VRLLPRRGPKREPLIRPEDILLSKRITWRIDEPFTIFECDRILPQRLTEQLPQQFPWDLLLRQLDQDNFRARLDEQANAKEFDALLRGSTFWTDVAHAVKSRAFRRDVRKVCQLALNARPRSSMRLLAIFYRWLPLCLTHTKLDFTAYSSGFYLSPHIDSEKKLLSLMIYVEYPGTLRSLSLGTGFWRETRVGASAHWYARLSGLPERALSEQPMNGVGLTRVFSSDKTVKSKDAQFRLDHERFHVATFATGRAAGFAKSRNSWHDVDLRDLTQGTLRGALLINVNLRFTKNELLKKAAKYTQFLAR